MGIDLVRDVAMRAEGEGRRRVDRKDVMAAASVPGSPAFAVRVAALSAGERVLLYRIAERSLSGDTMMAGAIFEEAQDYLATGRRENIDHPRVEFIEGRTTDLPPGAAGTLPAKGPLASNVTGTVKVLVAVKDCGVPAFPEPCNIHHSIRS